MASEFRATYTCPSCKTTAQIRIELPSAMGVMSVGDSLVDQLRRERDHLKERVAELEDLAPFPFNRWSDREYFMGGVVIHPGRDREEVDEGDPKKSWWIFSYKLLEQTTGLSPASEHSSEIVCKSAALELCRWLEARFPWTLYWPSQELPSMDSLLMDVEGWPIRDEPVFTNLDRR